MSEVQERPTYTVVTNENKADFVAEKLGWNKEPVAAVEKNPAEPITESSEAKVTDDATAADEQERKTNKLNVRFSEITKQREAARQEAERERQARIELENKLKDMEAKLKPAPQAAEADPKPKPEQFSDMFEYAEALSEWTADKRIKEEKAKETAQKVEQERQKTMDTWSNRVNDFREKTPDFDDLVGSADVTVSNEVRDAIFESDLGPQILYHLAENPDVAKKLQSMSAISALRMIGKLEAKFEDAPAPTPKETVVKTSKAPPPIKPIKASANGPVTELDDNRQFHGSYQAWKAARLAGRIR
jgi:hypothetical protein